jgi:membrane-associated HD superfamily phosphohydrolase
MICDSIEATARSLASNGKLEKSDDKKSVINNTINRLMDDDQLDDVKVGDLKKIRRVLYKELENKYHKRELYGDEDEAGDKDNLRIIDNGEEK